MGTFNIGTVNRLFNYETESKHAHLQGRISTEMSDFIDEICKEERCNRSQLTEQMVLFFVEFYPDIALMVQHKELIKAMLRTKKG